MNAALTPASLNRSGNSWDYCLLSRKARTNAMVAVDLQGVEDSRDVPGLGFLVVAAGGLGGEADTAEVRALALTLSGVTSWNPV
jgi:hypothetical protein